MSYGKKVDERAQFWAKAIKLKPGTAESEAYGGKHASKPQKPASNTSVMVENIELMNRLEGFDVVIVCTSTPQQVWWCGVVWCGVVWCGLVWCC